MNPRSRGVPHGASGGRQGTDDADGEARHADVLARHAELPITASANEPLWDGAPIDYGAVIDALVGAEQAEAIEGWS
jgi:hypothetical protein